MVGIYKSHLGRGPTKASTTIRDDLVVTVLTDSLTRAEQKLRDTGRGAMVRSIRREFQDTMCEEMVALVQETLGREVICMLSDHVPEPDYAVEVLILVPAEDGDRTSEIQADAAS